MIIKGRAHDHAANLSRYLLAEKDNEQVRLIELRDAASDDLAKALTDWETIGRCITAASRILYHAHIRLCDGEKLNGAQWMKAIADLEEALGFTNCPRAIVAHDNKNKGTHVHVVWSRVDPTQKPLVNLSNDHEKHHRVAREAEKEFGLKPTIYQPKDWKKRRLSDREIRALKDRGINREKLEKLCQAAWNACDSGQEMKAMLGALGVDITAGDRRDWVVEYKGLKMNPVRLLDGVNAAQFRERMKDVDLEAEKQKSREESPAMPTFGKKARHAIQAQIDKAFANDTESPPKTGFRKKRHAPQPKLRRKMFYGDPGI